MPAQLPVDDVGADPPAESPVMAVHEPFGQGRPGVFAHVTIITVGATRRGSSLVPRTDIRLSPTEPLGSRWLHGSDGDVPCAAPVGHPATFVA